MEEKLAPGIKILDSKLGVRADQMRNPSFILSLGGPAREEEGEVFGGSLEWATSCPPPRHNFTSLPRIRSERPALDLHHPELAAESPQQSPVDDAAIATRGR